MSLPGESKLQIEESQNDFIQETRVSGGNHGAHVFRRPCPRSGPAGANCRQDCRFKRRQSASDLAKKLQNPIGDLYSFPFQGNTNFGVGPHSCTQEILNVQPVIPFHVSDDWNIITRTILPLVWNPDMSPLPSSAFGTAPTTFSAFLSPRNPTNGWLWGVGPVVQIPDRHFAHARLQRLGRRRHRRPRLYERTVGCGRAGQQCLVARRQRRPLRHPL